MPPDYTFSNNMLDLITTKIINHSGYETSYLNPVFSSPKCPDFYTYMYLVKLSQSNIQLTRSIRISTVVIITALQDFNCGFMTLIYCPTFQICFLRSLMPKLIKRDFIIQMFPGQILRSGKNSILIAFRFF